MSAPKTATLNLNRGSARLLLHLLQAAEWYAGDQAAGHLARTGAIIEDPALDLPPTPKVADPKQLTDEERAAEKEWSAASVTFEPTFKQLDTIKVCVQHFVKRGALFPGAASARLLREVGLAPEGE